MDATGGYSSSRRMQTARLAQEARDAPAALLVLWGEVARETAVRGRMYIFFACCTTTSSHCVFVPFCLTRSTQRCMRSNLLEHQRRPSLGEAPSPYPPGQKEIDIERVNRGWGERERETKREIKRRETRDKARERQRDRQTGGHIDRGTDGQRDRQTHTDTQTQRGRARERSKSKWSSSQAVERQEMK